MAAAPLPATALSAEEVAAYLRAHPRFLADTPELYRALAPPVRVHGEHFADHMAALLRAERGHASAMAARADDVLAAGRAAAGLTQRVQEAVLILIAAGNVAECVAAEFPAALAIDAATLCVEVEGPATPGSIIAPGGVGTPSMIETLLGGRAVLFRTNAPPDPILHGEAARLAIHEALVRVPGAAPPAMLALAARNADALDAAQGTGALAFLGRAVAAALRR